MSDESNDIIIVGGGIAGYAAALAASEKNSVTLIEGSSNPGGATTQTNVGTLCGLYFRSSSPTLIPHPFCQSFVRDLYRFDNKAKLVTMADDLHVISYEWSNLQKYVEGKLRSGKINLLVNSKVIGAHSEGDVVKNILVTRENKNTIVGGKAFIDCSGTGVLAQLLNHGMIKEKEYQSASQIIRLGNVQALNEYSLNLALKRTMVKNGSVNQWPRSYSSISVVPGSLSENKVDLKIPLATTITDDPNQHAVLKKEVDNIVAGLLSVIKEVESLSGATIEFVFPSPGVRIQQRPKGQTILTEDHVLDCNKSNDGIALGTWPIEEWDYNGKVTLHHLRGDGFTIPAGCLMSPFSKNLFFSGKGISAETRAIASARVTGTCLQTGYAAGKMAACSNDIEREKVIQEINSQISLR